MFLSKTLTFYKREEVQKKLVKHAEDKEIAVQYGDYFGSRPESIMYQDDVMELIKNKATSFHCSEELWTNPLSLRSDIKRNEMNELRKGWDLILDIDCLHFKYSKLAADILINIIKDLDVDSVTCKFSGNKGFHIGIAWEAFPEKVGDRKTKNLFPEAPKRIAVYLKDKLEPILEDEILKDEDVQKISKRTGIEISDLIIKNKGDFREKEKRLDVGKFLEIDTILIAPRHLYRMPYSFHEKSQLVSVPIDPDSVMSFEKEMGEPENISFNHDFLIRDVERGEASKLIINAFDHKPKSDEDEEMVEKKDYDVPDDAIPEEHFPPSIKRLLEGLEDGRKRALFTLINFYRCCGYDMESIQQKMHEWNERNDEPLKETYIKGQINYAKKQKEAIPPHNYPHGGSSYYKDLGVWDPDDLEKNVKNPIQYAKIKYEEE